MKQQKIYYAHPSEHEEASYAYLMAVIAIIAGMPLPIINVIASFIFFLAKRKSSYFVRWHSLQALLAQLIVIPFNSVAFGWTLYLVFKDSFLNTYLPHHSDYTIGFYNAPFMYYCMYIAFVLLLNVVEFFSVIYTSSRVGKGENVRWFFIASITDALTSKQDRNPYTL